MLDNPHTMIQDRFTRPVNNAEVLERVPCCDCRRNRTPDHDPRPAFVHVQMPTMAAYLCSDHFQERKDKDDVARKIDHALSQAFSAGNYAAAYTSEDLDTAWEVLEDEERELRDDLVTKLPWRAAFVIGFFGSCEPDEIDSDHKEEHDSAMHTWGSRMAQLGIAVDLDMCEECDGYVSSDHLEMDGHKGHAVHKHGADVIIP